MVPTRPVHPFLLAVWPSVSLPHVCLTVCLLVCWSVGRFCWRATHVNDGTRESQSHVNPLAEPATSRPPLSQPGNARNWGQTKANTHLTRGTVTKRHKRSPATCTNSPAVPWRPGERRLDELRLVGNSLGGSGLQVAPGAPVSSGERHHCSASSGRPVANQPLETFLLYPHSEPPLPAPRRDGTPSNAAFCRSFCLRFTPKHAVSKTCRHSAQAILLLA